jgi:hypothetical protein
MLFEMFKPSEIQVPSLNKIMSRLWLAQWTLIVEVCGILSVMKQELSYFSTVQDTHINEV